MVVGLYSNEFIPINTYIDRVHPVISPLNISTAVALSNPLLHYDLTMITGITDVRYFITEFATPKYLIEICVNFEIEKIIMISGIEATSNHTVEIDKLIRNICKDLYIDIIEIVI